MAKKILVVLLALTLLLAFVGCDTTEAMTAEKIRAEYNSFDWNKTDEMAKKSEAQKLLAEINSMEASAQQEVNDIKVKLDEIIAGGTQIEPEPSEINPDLEDPNDLDPNKGKPEDGETPLM